MEDKKHVVAVKLDTEQYSVLRKLWAERMINGEDDGTDGRSGPGSLVQRLVLHALGAINDPDNPLVNRL